MSYTIRVRPSLIVASRNSNKRPGATNWRKPPERKTHQGKLSPNARRKLKNALRWLVACSDVKQCYEKKKKDMVDYRVNLATFTFKKNMQDDNKARKLFSMWLEMARYRFALERYVWKAEPQERGAIHFHLVSGIYLPHKEVCYTWNRLLSKNGLHQPNANSTDVHAVQGVYNLEAYLTEYMMNEDKHEGRRPIKGKLWGCDHKLSQAGKKYLYVDDDDARALQESLDKFSLRHRLKTIPEFLNFTDVYCVPSDFYQPSPGNELEILYRQELELLKPSLRQPEFFPR